MDNSSSSDFSPSRSRLPEWVAQQLRADFVSQYGPGDRLPTVQQMADKFKVSKHSVSMALEILVREGSIEKSPSRGISVALHAPQKWVGIVSEMDLLYPLSSSFFTQLVTHARRQLEMQGLLAEIYIGRTLPWEVPEEPTCPRFVSDLRRGNLSGVIIATAPDNDAWRKLMKSTAVPVVGSIAGRSIETDYAKLIHAGLEALAKQGCRRVAMLGWQNSAPAEVFIQTARQLGMETSADFVRHDLHPGMPGSGWEEFREVWSASSHRPDGMLITDDALLGEVASTAAELGISVPGRLKIAAVTHGIASTALPFPMIALEIDTQAAAGILVDLLLHQMGRLPAGPASSTIPFTVREYRATRAVRPALELVNRK